MSREELKRLWFNIDHSKTPEMKRITITMDKYKDRIGQGTIEIIRETSDGFMNKKTHQEFPYTYLCQTKEYLSEEYELIIKE